MTTTTPATSPLDEPRSQQHGRSYEYFWPLTRVTGDGYQGPGWAGVQLSVHHDRDGKRFWTSVHPTTVFNNGWSETSISLLTTPAWRKIQPVARYSAKALDAFAAATLAGFRQAYTDDHPGVRALFDTRPPADAG